MPHILDSDTLIRAKNHHYRFKTCPGFWDWLDYAIHNGKIHIIKEVYAEICKTERPEDDLAKWIKTHQSSVVQTEDRLTQEKANLISTWIESEGYRSSVVHKFMDGADLWLISYAGAYNHTLITHERSAPQSKKSIKIPDIGKAFNIRYDDPFNMLQSEGVRLVLDGPSINRSPKPDQLPIQFPT